MHDVSSRHRAPRRPGHVIRQALVAAMAIVSTLGAAPPADRQASRIVAVGDIHGDLDAFAGILREAEVLDADRRWSGGRATLVQTGDYLDRGASAREVVDLLIALEGEAAAAGGRAVVLVGNHEVMNMMGDVRDVAPEAYARFADEGSEARRVAAYDAHVELSTKRRQQLERVFQSDAIPRVYQPVDRAEWLAARPPGFIEYVEAFAADGQYGRWLRDRPIVARIEDTVFVHGGINPDTAPRSLDAANTRARREMARWDRMRKTLLSRDLALPFYTFQELIEAMRAELDRAFVEAQREELVAPGEVPASVTRHPLAEMPQILNWSILHADGPLWFRGFATWTSSVGAQQLDQLQRRYGPVRFVVGHTVVQSARIVPRFSARVFLIDTGMLATHYKGRASALEIAGRRYSAIYVGQRELLEDVSEAASARGAAQEAAPDPGG